jgi:tetratricopeptide (TPR) repeat protein
MRKTILFTAILFMSASLMAQSIDAIKDLAGKNDWAKAKDAVDKYLSNEKNAKKADGWYWKAVIYNGISRDQNLNSQHPDARMQAFEAYKKYIELDPKMTWGILSQHGTLFDVCFGYLEDAGNAFNNKDYERSLENFKKAEKVEEYIVAKGFTLGEFAFPAFDTQLYLNIAAAATQAKKEDVALEYYMKIAENKIVEDNYVEIYRYVVDRLTRKGDLANKEKFLKIGRELYPDDPFWCEVDLIEAGEDPVKMFPIYEKLMQGPCGTYELMYNYAVDLFNYLYAGESKPANFTEKQTKLTEVLQKTIAKESTIDANLLMSKHIFSQINEIYDEVNAIKGTKPEDVKKKADLNAQMTKKYEEAIPYASTAYNLYDKQASLKPVEKGNFKLIINMLIECYDRKNDKAKVKELQDKMKSIE